MLFGADRRRSLKHNFSHPACIPQIVSFPFLQPALYAPSYWISPSMRAIAVAAKGLPLLLVKPADCNSTAIARSERRLRFGDLRRNLLASSIILPSWSLASISA
jgi:hypothetical protein